MYHEKLFPDEAMNLTVYGRIGMGNSRKINNEEFTNCQMAITRCHCGHPELPKNKVLALRRLEKLETQMEKDQPFYQHNRTFINELLQRGYAEPVPEDETNVKKVWYIQHHGVCHPRNQTNFVLYLIAVRIMAASHLTNISTVSNRLFL